MKEDSDEGILQICTSFYQDLYSSQNINDNDIDCYLEDISVQNILTETEKEKCEGKIITKECLNALNQMKRNKSPGMDGIIIEFYQQFWDLLKDLLIDMFNECYDLGSLPDSMRTAIISLIFKKGDQENLDNYRPISLTNTDYRILAFTLAERIQQV